ncbi:SusD/RagB family nutrient-binding outer membrane lipoprotein [Bacteroidota bacterium]
MKKIYNKLIALNVIILLLFSNSCDLNQQEDPNNLTSNNVDIEFLLNRVQLSYTNLTIGDKRGNEPGLNNAAREAVRMLQQFGPYTGAFTDLTATSLNRVWSYGYMKVLKNGMEALALAEEEGLPYHAGVARTIMALCLANLVDHFNDIPWSQALDAANYPMPEANNGEDVYDVAMEMLDLAIEDFNETPPGIPNDYYFNGSAASWLKAIASIKLKMYLNLRLIDASGSTSAINQLIADGFLIDEIAEDFEFQYSTVAANPDSRHPDYRYNYDANGGDDYMSNWYMSSMKDDPPAWDPRMRYYFYRQIEEDPTGDDLPCTGLNYDYCYIGDYYWGRDHADDEGVPPDQLKRTVTGIYPAGGAFDGDNFMSVNDNPGAGGEGIFPIMLSSWVNFMLAEASLTLGTTGDARTYLENGLTQSIEKVMTFGAPYISEDEAAFIPTDTAVDDHINWVLANYDNAANDAERLDIIIKEYFIALWGNGMEAYNAIRRTGYPSDVQDPVIVSGPFPRTYQYPSDLVLLNDNFDQRVVTERVFWDNNETPLQ